MRFAGLEIPGLGPSNRPQLVSFAVIVATTAMTVLAWSVSVQSTKQQVAELFYERAAQTSELLEAALRRNEHAITAMIERWPSEMMQAEWDTLAAPWLATQGVAGPHGLARVEFDSTAGPETVFYSGEFPEPPSSLYEEIVSSATDGLRTTLISADASSQTITTARLANGSVYLATFTVPRFLEQFGSRPVGVMTLSISQPGQMVLADPSTGSAPLSLQSRIAIGGEEIVLDFVASTVGTLRGQTRTSTIILICGLIVDAGIVTLFMLFSNVRQQAARFNEALSHELDAEKLHLEASNIALERYAQMSSHDLRTPLRAIRDLQDELFEDMADRFADVASDVAFNVRLTQTGQLLTRMDRLIDGTLEYTQLAQHLKDVQTIDTAVFVQRICHRYQNCSTTVNIQGHWPIVQCSLKLLTVILDNLVQNAVQHHPRPEQVCVTLHSKLNEKALIMQVSDDGNGVEERFQDRIFDMFQTLSPAHETEATGLGLAIVKRAVTLIGGHISVRSTEGKGATFSVMLHGILDHSAPQRQRAT